MPVVLGYKTVVGICEDVVKYKCFRQIKVLLFFHALEIAHKHSAMFLIASETRCEGNRQLTRFHKPQSSSQS